MLLTLHSQLNKYKSESELMGFFVRYFEKLLLDVLNEFLQFLNGYLLLKSPGAFCLKRIVQAFGRFSGWILAQLALIQSQRYLQHDSSPFFHQHRVSVMTFWLRHAQKSKFKDKKIKRPMSFQVRLLYFLIFFRFSPFPFFQLQ